MATLITTITNHEHNHNRTLTNQMYNEQLMNHSQTNSRAGAQPNRFRVCCFVGLHLCISFGKYLVVDLDLVTLFTSYPGIFMFFLSPSCFASHMITANWGFNRLIRMPISTPTSLEVPKHLSCQQGYLYRAKCSMQTSFIQVSRFIHSPSTHPLI